MDLNVRNPFMYGWVAHPPSAELVLAYVDWLDLVLFDFDAPLKLAALGKNFLCPGVPCGWPLPLQPWPGVLSFGWPSWPCQLVPVECPCTLAAVSSCQPLPSAVHPPSY